MAIIVKKFGGTSVGSIDRIRNIARKIAQGSHSGEQVVIVVSAMGKTTDELFGMAYQITDHPSRRELDMLLTAGERITMSLLSLSLQEEGFSSISFTGSQSGIITDDKHGNARILRVNAFRILEELNKGKIVIVAGFQGVSLSKEITTLGRGGSDTSAVALACYLNAEKCEIYTDVDGVYSADPRIVNNPLLIPKLDYAQMLALAYNGSKVLHPRAVEFGYKFGIPVEIKSSFTFGPGTLLYDPDHDSLQKDNIMEDRKISAIAHKDKLICYQIAADDNTPTLLRNWTHEIFKFHVRNDELMIYVEDKYDSEIVHVLEANHVHIQKKTVDLGFVILVGIGINLDLSYLAQTIALTKGFEIIDISHSEKTIELLMPTAMVNQCVNALHQEFIGGTE